MTTRLGAGRTALVGSLLLLGSLAAYTPGTVSGGGTVSGTITYTGAAPAPRKLEITEDVDFCGQWGVQSEDLLVSAGKGLANVVVFLDGVTTGKALTPTKATLDNTKCRYEPHVQALAVGSTLAVGNKDPILHNTHIRLPKSDVANYALPLEGQVFQKQLTRTGLMKVGCDAGHTWMTAYIAVFDHPYFAVTGTDGKFSMPEVPAGSYTLVAWHEKLGQKTQAVTVTSSGEARVSLAWP